MKVFCIVGMSSCGKDTIYKKVLEEFKDSLKPIVTWTTRDARLGEVDGREYHFSDDATFQKQLKEDKVVEYRIYNSFGRILTYYTCSEDFDNDSSYIVVTSLSQVNKYADYFGCKNVYPICVELDDWFLLTRALSRCKDTKGSYKEVCRRYISDCEEWENTKFNDELNVFKVYNGDLSECCEKVYNYIKEVLAGCQI